MERFIEIIQFTLQEFESDVLIREDEVIAVRKLIFIKLNLDLPEHLQEEGNENYDYEHLEGALDEYQEI